MEIVRFNGDTYPIVAQLTEDDLPVDLTGAIVTLSIGFKTPISIIGVLTAPTAGTVQFNFTRSEVTTAGKFSYDVQVEDSSGYITTYIKDFITFTTDITT